MDYQVQEFLKERLREEWPDFQFMGEEKDNSDIDFDGTFWILDPVDGTTNLIHDFRNSAVSLGLCDKGAMICGVFTSRFPARFSTLSEGKGPV